MKTIYKSILFVAIAGIMGLLTVSCDESEGTPFISYVRVSDPAIKDSLLVEGSQGQLVVFMGGNLQNTSEVWFNDQRASLNPFYVTNKSVMVNVPTAVPLEITNKVKLVFSNGTPPLLYDFTVKISKPVLDYMDCEYALAGQTAVIHGTYFYLPITVTFPGGATASSEEGTVKANEDNTILSVKVPEGATEPGQLTVASNFGTTKSNFWFLDNRNIFEGFDPHTGAGTSISNPGPGDPPLINGNYSRLTKTIGSWAWTEVFSWRINHNIPDDAILNPRKYNYKFEVNTIKPYNANGIRIWVTSQASNTNGKYFEWNAPPGIDTQGEWHTVVFPLENVMAKNENIGVLDNYFFAFIFCGNGTLDCDMCFDNFRIVPKTLPGSN